MFIKNKLLPLLYALCIFGYLIFGLFNFAYNLITIKEEINIPLSSVATENLKQIDENTFISVTNDPQLIIDIDLEKLDARTIKYTLSQGGTGEKALYYQTDKLSEYSGKRCIMPKGKQSQEVEYILPNKNISRIRLDISGTGGETIKVESITVNYKPHFIEYFNLSPMTIARLLILPLLIGSVLGYIIEMYEFYIKKQR